MTVLHVGLAARQIFAMARVDQTDFDPGGFEELKQGTPVNAGGLQRHRGDTTVLEPIAQRVQVFGERGKQRTGRGSRPGGTAT